MAEKGWHASTRRSRTNLQEALDLFFESAGPGEIAERFHREVYVTQLDVAVG